MAWSVLAKLKTNRHLINSNAILSVIKLNEMKMGLQTSMKRETLFKKKD